jgi:hypothetical protein
MPDRVLAMKIELHIWCNGPIPQPQILQTYLEAFKASEDESDWWNRAREILQASGCEFEVVAKDDGTGSVSISRQPMGAVRFTAEALLVGELLEGLRTLKMLPHD